jgi:hypothetical protein
VQKLPRPDYLCGLTIDQWEASVGFAPLPPSPVNPDVGGIGVKVGEA